MGSGCLRCATSAVVPAALPPRKEPVLPPLVVEATSAVALIASTTLARGSDGLGARLNHSIALVEELRGAGHVAVAEGLEDRLVQDAWPAFERCVPELASPKASASNAGVAPHQTFGRCGTETIGLAEDLRLAAGQLLGVAVRARAEDDAAPAARLVARLAQLEMDVVLALVSDALAQGSVRLLRYARDRVAAALDAAGCGGLAVPLAARLLEEQHLVASFEPFGGFLSGEERTRRILESICDLLDLVAGMAQAEDEAAEASDIRANARDMHAQVLQRLALRTLCTSLGDLPRSWSSAPAAVALQDLQRAARLGVLEPLDAFGAPTCAAWLELSTLPAGSVAGARELQIRGRLPRWLRACLEHQQAALAAAPFLRSLDVPSTLVALLRERLLAAFREGRWPRLDQWAHLATGLELSLREMLGIDRARRCLEPLGGVLAELAGFRLVWLAAAELRAAEEVTLATQTSSEEAEGIEFDGLEFEGLGGEPSMRKACVNCGLNLFFCASSLRRSYTLRERTCPNCFMFQSLDEPQPGVPVHARSLAMAAQAELPTEARALQAYAWASVPATSSGLDLASAAQSLELERGVGGQRLLSQYSGSEMHTAHRGFLEALRARMWQLVDSPRKLVLLACMAVRCHVAADVGFSYSELWGQLSSEVAAPGSKLEAELRETLESGVQAEQALKEWRQVIAEASAADDAGALRAALAWAAERPSAQGCGEYLVALEAYRRLREVPQDWALGEVLDAGEEVAAWRAGARVAAAGGEAAGLRAALRTAALRPQLAALGECRLAVEAYRRLRVLPDSWDLAEVMKFDEEVLKWRESAEAARLSQDHRALHFALATAAEAPHLRELEEFGTLVERYRELLQLPGSWEAEEVLRLGPVLADWREHMAPLVRVGPEELRTSAGSLDRLRRGLASASGCLYMEAAEEFQAGVRLLRTALNLPDAWTATEVLHRGEEAAAWRAAAAQAVATRCPGDLVSVLLRARRCRFAQAFPEYHSAMACLARHTGIGPKAMVLDLERLPAAWDLEDQPYMVRKDSKGVNVISRRSLNHFVHSQLLTILQDLVDKSCQSIRTRDRKDGSKVPQHYKVDMVEHVMNLRSWQVYLRARDRIAEKDRGRRPGASLKDEQLLTSSGPAAQLLQEFRAAGGPLHEELNECLLWHGTLPASADQIAIGDFKLALAGSHTGTMYGRGLYFAEAFTKSDEYARHTDEQGRRAMLLCRCTMGRYLYVDEEPCARQLEASVLFGEYDSVLGDRRKLRGTYREFVFFDADLVYPAFLVWYRRSTDA